MKSIYFYPFLFLFFLSCSEEQSFKNGNCLPGIPIRTTMSQGGFATIALSNSGEIWQWIVGREEEVQLMTLPIENVCHIDLYRPYGMTLTGIALQRNGKVITWNIPTGDNLVEFPFEKKVKKIAGGMFHALVLFNDGTVGGLGNEIGFAGFNALKDVVDIAAGNECSIACTKEGKVYVTGQNSGSYIAYDNELAIIENAFQIPGLKDIVRVGTTDQQDYYAVDKMGQLYYWNTQTHIKKVSYQKTPEKAKAVLKDGFYLTQDLKIRWRPDYENNKNSGAFLDWETDPKLEGALNVYHFRNYAVALKNDGSVIMYDLQEQRKGRFVGHKIVSEQIIPNLKVDLSYYN